jgi:hypothetical protein
LKRPDEKGNENDYFSVDNGGTSSIGLPGGLSESQKRAFFYEVNRLKNLAKKSKDKLPADLDWDEDSEAIRLKNLAKKSKEKLPADLGWDAISAASKAFVLRGTQSDFQREKQEQNEHLNYLYKQRHGSPVSVHDQDSDYNDDSNNATNKTTLAKSLSATIDLTSETKECSVCVAGSGKQPGHSGAHRKPTRSNQLEVNQKPTGN